MTHTLAIIGAGPAAVSVLAGIASEAATSRYDGFTILLYAPDGVIGPGLAYGAHNPPSFICNHEIMMMGSAFPDISGGGMLSFKQWCACHAERLSESYPDTDFLNPTDYAPRSCYGLYVTESYDAAAAALQRAGISITIKSCYVHDVIPTEQGVTVQDEQGAVRADIALLATGVAFKEHPFMIPAYDAARWQREAPESGNGAAVIIGSGLSAYEAALGCIEGGYYRHVTMISRSGTLRRVRCPFLDYTPRFFTEEALNIRAGGADRPLRLHDILQCLAQEINVLYGESSPFFARETTPESVLDDMLAREADDIVADFLNDCDRMHDTGLWRGLRQAITDTFRARIFRRLHPDDMPIFRRYASLYESFNSPISLVSAARLSARFRDGSIALRKGSPTVTACNEGGYTITCATHTFTCDSVINATGFSQDIAETPLYSRLLARGDAVLHPNGGILTDPDTCAVHIPDSNMAARLFALGHMHKGTLLISATPHLTRTGVALGRRLLHTMHNLQGNDSI